MKDKILNFKDKASYERWLAYGHIHHKFEEARGNQEIEIKGKKIKPKHQQ